MLARGKKKSEILIDGSAALAALVNESRARSHKLSGDRFAELWVPQISRQNVRQMWDSFSQSVYPLDDLVLATRTKYFLEVLDRSMSHKDRAIIAPAGLTSYPYLVSSKPKFIEADILGTMQFKTERAKALVKKGRLPSRDVERRVFDLNDTESLLRLLRPESQGRTVLLMEGISYYIDAQKWMNAISAAKAMLKPNDIIAFDFWPSSESCKEIYTKFFEFCLEHGGSALSDFSFFSSKDIEYLGSGCTVEVTSVCEAEATLFNTRRLQNQPILRDTYALLTVNGR